MKDLLVAIDGVEAIGESGSQDRRQFHEPLWPGRRWRVSGAIGSSEFRSDIEQRKEVAMLK